MILLQTTNPFSGAEEFISGLINDDSLISGAIFSATRAYIYGMIRNFGLEGFGNIQKLLLSVMTVYLTLWFIYQGWLIATGRSQENLTRFAQKSVTTLLIVWIALIGTHHSANIVDFIEGLQGIVTAAIAGDNYKNPENMVDGSLILMQVMGNKLRPILSDADSGQNTLSTGLVFISSMGIALPALVSGGLLLLNKIALYLCVMFAPLCLVAYIFEQTRFMFTAWVKFTVTTLFTLAVITVIVTIAMKAVLFVAAALMLAEMTGGVDLESIASVQGGMGMLLTTLVLGAPPLVTNFFSGAVAAQFQAYNNIGNIAGGQPAAGPQDLMNRQNTQPRAEAEVDPSHQNMVRAYNAGTQTQPQEAGRRGIAGKKQE